MKIGVNISLNVSKIDKEKLYKGATGTWLNLTTFIDTDNVDQYGNHGMVTQSVSKEEREAGTRGAILGNNKIFCNDSNSMVKSQASKPASNAPVVSDADLPF